MWPELLGGIGVFLLGMGLLTEGLKDLAGDGLRRFLHRFAGNRYSAAATGVVTTAIIQSSSATSLIAIGLVGAGLIALPQGIAILIGANVGTSATSYLVALVGLKFSVAAYALPVIGIGALGRIFIQGRWRSVATALVGFGLLFLGIDLMRAAASELADGIDIGQWAGTGFLGAVILVFVGILMTVLVQSSSAAMATTLTTLSVGAITLEQAALLAIGQNVGTTVTALFGSIGGSPSAKRAAFAHVAFNVGTALPAFLLVRPLLGTLVRLAGGDNVLALAYFHTVFNVIGLLIFLPLVHRMARILERLVPEPRDELTSSLDRTVLQTGGSAAGAADRALEAITDEVVQLVRSRMRSARRPRDWSRRVTAAKAALGRVGSFLDEARRRNFTGERTPLQIASMDHLRHMLLDIDDEVQPASPAVHEALGPFVAGYLEILEDVRLPAVDGRLKDLVRQRKLLRKQLLQRVETDAAFGPQDARVLLEALHWMDRTAWHLRRTLQARPSESQG